MSTWSLVGILVMVAGVILTLAVGVISLIKGFNKVAKKIFMLAILIGTIGAIIMCLVLASN